MPSYVDERAEDGLNAYLLTARHGRVAMLQVLDGAHGEGSQDHRLNPGATQWSALHEAARHGHVEAVMYLMRKDNTLEDTRDRWKRSPLDLVRSELANHGESAKSAFVDILKEGGGTGSQASNIKTSQVICALFRQSDTP